MKATAGLLLLALLLAGCRQQPSAPDYVARVGNQYLHPGELSDALSALPPGADSTSARQQVIQQWVTDALLYREAQRRGLQDDADVAQRLRESRRSVLTSALVKRLYAQQSSSPSRRAMRAYFQQHREVLRLREPYVRVRHLAAATRSAADSVHRALQQTDTPEQAPEHADALWSRLARRAATDTARALRLARHYHPESDLFTEQPGVHAKLQGLDDHELVPVFASGGHFHVLQLVKRMPAGTLPELDWVKGDVRQRLLLQQRKQMYARQVERLRSQARSKGVLDVP